MPCYKIWNAHKDDASLAIYSLEFNLQFNKITSAARRYIERHCDMTVAHQMARSERAGSF